MNRGGRRGEEHILFAPPGTYVPSNPAAILEWIAELGSILEDALVRDTPSIRAWFAGRNLACTVVRGPDGAAYVVHVPEPE